MGFTQAIRSGFENYINFRGRASRSEYWYFVLFIFVSVLPLALIDQFVIGWPLGQVAVSLGTIVPSLSVLVRRLHDIGRSGWYYFIALVPVVGVIVLLYWLCKPGMAETNEYGDAQTRPDDSDREPGHRAAPADVWLTATYRGASVKLDKTRSAIRIGRGQNNDIVVPDMLASANHARIECRGDRFFLKDQSSNGTFVSAHRMQDAVVTGGEVELEGSGLIGLGRPTAASPESCIRFAVQRSR